MHHPLIQLSDGLAHSGCRTLLYTMIVFLVLLQSGDGQHQVVGPSQPIRATIGDDIILPCHLEPAKDASDMKLEWARPDLNPRFIHVRANRQEYVIHKQPSYKGRTSVSNDKLKHGDVSLTLSKVKVSDEGLYRCLIPSLNQAAFIQLIVGAVSSPVISLENRSSRRVVLQCESAGWYPEPEVLWLDGEGKLHSAGPTETVRGPDDLYTVSSRVTVEKRHSNSFTCRVQQRNINQTRETHIQVPVLSMYVKCVMAPGLVCVCLSGVLTVLGWRPRLIVVRQYLNERTQRTDNHETAGTENQTAPLQQELQAQLLICDFGSKAGHTPLSSSGAVSTPIIEIRSYYNGSVVLQCESAGWYPEPEVLWLDGEGKLLSAGPTETVRGPDDLYTVSSRVTVEKRHSNSFTCRVQQRNINQTTETHIQVPDDYFMDLLSSSWIWSNTLAIIAVVLSVIFILLCQWR
ncbi:butyrophilin subfamily 2 member A1-like [Epinephelus lanceolatus]